MPDMLNGMRASVIIPSFNEDRFLARTVESCLETTAGLDLEVLVADDASTDDSLEVLARSCPGVAIHAHPRRLGVSPTKDLGARKAVGDVLVFIDGHCKVEPGAIERLVADVEALDGKAVVTPAVPPLDVAMWATARPARAYGYRLDLPSFSSGWLPADRLRQQGRFFESPALVGCCLAVGRALYEELGGFDVHMLEYGMEDIDFGLKAWLMGYPVLNDPQAVIGHRFRARFETYSVTWKHLLANKLRTARKHFRDETWELWIQTFRAAHPPPLREPAWEVFRRGEESCERERAFLLEHRVRGEYWYAMTFDLAWPAF
jgi:glycosyltransferase involved in cell wall biosynthesis